MRRAAPLKEMFRGQSGVSCVDNERIFSLAVERRGYLPYFHDLFAGDFGHCSIKGNVLLAYNIAGVILKECIGYDDQGRPQVKK